MYAIYIDIYNYALLCRNSGGVDYTKTSFQYPENWKDSLGIWKYSL